MDKETYYVPYEGRDMKILDEHARNTVIEDIESFDSQLENHFAHVIMLAEQNIISKKDAADIMKALLEIDEDYVVGIAIALGKSKHSSTIVDEPHEGSWTYYADETRDFYVPKLPLSELVKWL